MDTGVAKGDSKSGYNSITTLRNRQDIDKTQNHQSPPYESKGEPCARRMLCIYTSDDIANAKIKIYKNEIIVIYRNTGIQKYKSIQK